MVTDESPTKPATRSPPLSQERLREILSEQTDLPDSEITERVSRYTFPVGILRLFSNVGDQLDAEYSIREYYQPDEVVKGKYTWDHYQAEYFYDGFDFDTGIGCVPHEDEEDPETGETISKPRTFSKEDALGESEESFIDSIGSVGDISDTADELLSELTVDIDTSIDEDAFFSTSTGVETVTTAYDLEKSVPDSKKSHFVEIDRYWVNKPFSFIVLFRSLKENEYKYYAIEPHMNKIEKDFEDFIRKKINQTLQYRDGDNDENLDSKNKVTRAVTIENEFKRIVEQLEIYAHTQEFGMFSYRPLISNLTNGRFFPQFYGGDPIDHNVSTDKNTRQYSFTPENMLPKLKGHAVRPEQSIVNDDPDELTQSQLFKIMYYLKRDFVGYEKIDPIKNDVNVEDISCDGYNSPVFVYHTKHEQIITNIYHGETELDDFVTKMAQRSGKGISKRRPQVDATLPDGSRAQLTLGREVSAHGTNYTIRQFKDIPFTPVDLINWKTFSLDEMAFLWLSIENNRSLIFAGGTASGKTTSLNAVSLFIPSNSKIVSIEDTREVELPQRNWIASVTRPSFTGNESDTIDEFKLLESALRQRPDYIIMGEIRGEEGRTAFQVMSTGHTTYTTFHADSVSEVIKRFTTDPINVSKTLFTALDLVSIQTSTRVDGEKVRRNKVLTEINEYDSENAEINVRDVFKWQASRDEFMFHDDVNTVDEIKFDRGWDDDELEYNIFIRRVALAYLIKHDLNTYAEVASTLQAFIRDPQTILTLMKYNELSDSLNDLREMESVEINVNSEDENLVPRPSTPDDVSREVENVLQQAEDELYPYLPTLEEIDIQSVGKKEPDAPKPEKDEEAVEELRDELREKSSYEDDDLDDDDTNPDTGDNIDTSPTDSDSDGSVPKITNGMLGGSDEPDDDDSPDVSFGEEENFDDSTDDKPFKSSEFESSLD